MATPATNNVAALLRSRGYLVLLVLAAVIGAPVAAVAYWFLYLVVDLQKWLYNPSYLIKWLGFHGEPIWWPLPLLVLAGVLVGLTIRYLPGRGGHSPADGFQMHGPPSPRQIPGVAVAALAGLALGAVIGPEAPLIALGGGLAAAAVRSIKRDAPQQSITLLGGAGSFAALSTLFGSPVSSAFLLMEATGLGGPMLGFVLVPGLLAAGIGALVFVGFDAWTGHGVVSLAIPNLPPFAHPDAAQFGWAIVIGVVATFVGFAIHWLALILKPHIEARVVVLVPVLGLVVGGLAVVYAEWTGKPSSDVLFSGQTALPSLVTSAGAYSLGALLLLVVCKGLAYAGSLSGFRGGPTFPAMFVGAAGGMAMSHLPGLPEVAGVAMGMGAMLCVMLGLPLTSVLITTIFMGSDGFSTTPLVIVAVVVAYVSRAYLWPAPDSDLTPASGDSAGATPAAPVSVPVPPASPAAGSRSA